MPTKIYDFSCADSECGSTQEELLHGDDKERDITCNACGGPVTKNCPAPVTFTTIVPTTRTSKKHKAGYAHKYVNRPATKTQVGVGGGVTKGGGVHDG